jgi:hypothetical protein
MRTLEVSVLALLAALGLTSCSTLSVTTDYDRTASFTSYATYEFLPEQSIRNPLMRDRIESAIARQLEAKGMRRTGGRADLWIATHMRFDKETQIDTTHFGYGWGRWGYWGGGRAVTTVRQVPIGTLIVDLVDVREKKLVWQAVASDTLNPRASAAERDESVNAAVTKMFAGYPPKAQ